MIPGDAARRAGIVFLCVALAAVAIASAPAAASTSGTPIERAEYEYDAAALVPENSTLSRNGTVTLTLDPNGTVREGDRVRIELGDAHDGFAVGGARDATEGVGVAVSSTGTAIEFEFTDVSGNLSGSKIAAEVELIATDAVAGEVHGYDSTPVGSVTLDETESGLAGGTALEVTLDGTAEIGFDADSIDETIEGDNLHVAKNEPFVISFRDDSVWIKDGDRLNFSVDSEKVADGDESGFRIRGAVEHATQNKNISEIEVETSDGAGVLEGHDRITVTVRTVDGEPKLISGEVVAVNVQLAVETESMRSAADRYRDVDLFDVTVAGDNAELTDDAAVRTESPVRFDIHPGAAAGGFDLTGIDDGDEFAVSEGRSVGVGNLTDAFDNEVRRAKLDLALAGAEGTYRREGRWTATDGSGNVRIADGGAIEPRLGNFTVAVTVTDVAGPAEQSDSLQRTVHGVRIYPDNVTVRTAAGHPDFDAGGAKVVELDVGVGDDRIDRVDVELRRERGNGTLTFDRGAGGPTATDPWETTGYAGDGHLGTENAWAIERNLTAADFDDGVRRYALGADEPAAYELGVAVMPPESRLVPDAGAVATALGSDPGQNRNATELIATGEIAAVGNVSVRGNRTFLGIEEEEGAPVEIVLDGFEDGRGNAITDTDDAVAVRLANATAGTATPAAGNGSATVALDPTAIDTADVETGTDAEVAVEINGSTQYNTTNVTLVHRAIERPGGAWHPASIPQPATVYVDADGTRDLARWDAENDTYVPVAADAAGERLGADRVGTEQLHGGLYAYAERGPIRLGFAYATDADAAMGAGELELHAGWHFVGSNYDVSEHGTRSLAADANFAGAGFGAGNDSFAVWDADLTERRHDRTDGFDINGSEDPIGHDGSYWVRVADNGSLVRGIVSPTFSESEGVQP